MYERVNVLSSTRGQQQKPVKYVAIIRCFYTQLGCSHFSCFTTFARLVLSTQLTTPDHLIWSGNATDYRRLSRVEERNKISFILVIR